MNIIFENKNELTQLNLFSKDFYNLDLNKIYTKEKYIITNSNFLQVSYLFNFENWKIDKICLLHGPRFCGKSHICHISYEKNLNSILINKQNIELISNYDFLDQKSFVILDDLDYFDEEVIFHFFNYIRFSEKFLLLSARDEFLDKISLKDLRSRIFSVPNFHLNLIDENLARGIVIKILSDFDIILKFSQLKYICFNLDRSFDSIYRFTEKIKKFVLENSGKINIKTIKKFINEVNLKI